MVNLKKPFPANKKEELIQKVFNNPYDKLRPGVNQVWAEYINKMLRKDPARRPTIEEIIFSPNFQSMAVKMKVNLPLRLNK